jgi:hypothetical protein
MSGTKKIYLSKNGTVFGPFSEKDILNLKESGELEKFTWKCVDLAQGWVPVSPPPPPPLLPPNVSQESSLDQNDQIWTVICHNFKTIVSGTLKDMNREGCTLTQVSPSSKSVPLFRSGSRVNVNLLDNRTDRSENVQAVVHMAVKWEGCWDYRLRWLSVPQLLQRV